jgi:hypothetical protein
MRAARSNKQENSALVVFRGGFSADWNLVRRLLELEERGARLSLEPDGRFRVRPAAVLTDEDIAVLTERRDEARRIIDYIERTHANQV